MFSPSLHGMTSDQVADANMLFCRTRNPAFKPSPINFLFLFFHCARTLVCTVEMAIVAELDNRSAPTFYRKSNWFLGTCVKWFFSSLVYETDISFSALKKRPCFEPFKIFFAKFRSPPLVQHPPDHSVIGVLSRRHNFSGKEQYPFHIVGFLKSDLKRL